MIVLEIAWINSVQGFNWSDKFFKDFTLTEEICVYTYIPIDTFKIKEINKNNDNLLYLHLCCDGFIQHGEDFYKQFHQYTYDWEICYKHI